MRLLAVLLTMVSFGTPTFAADDNLGQHVGWLLKELTPDSGWFQGKALDPLIYILIHPGTKEDVTEDASRVTVVFEKMNSRMADFKTKLENGKIKAGDTHGKATLKKVQKDEACFKLDLRKISTSEDFKQYWCFSSTSVLGMSESGPIKVSSEFSQKIQNILKAGIQE